MQLKKKAELQEMMEDLIRMKNGNTPPADDDTDIYAQVNADGFETEEAASVPPTPY